MTQASHALSTTAELLVDALSVAQLIYSALQLPSVSTSLHHTLVFCRNGLKCHQTSHHLVSL